MYNIIIANKTKNNNQKKEVHFRYSSLEEYERIDNFLTTFLKI